MGASWLLRLTVHSHAPDFLRIMEAFEEGTEDYRLVSLLDLSTSKL